MTEQTMAKQIAREYYNVVYGAKLNLASFDTCEKLPSIISFISLALGILALSFESFNSKILASFLLIAGIVGLMLKPREMQKAEYKKAGDELTAISKKLELLHSQDSLPEEERIQQLKTFQNEHHAVLQPTPILLTSWFAHYKLFSEHNNKWFCTELGLTWKDKIPLTLRSAIIILLISLLVYMNPNCFFSKSWTWIQEPCPNGCLIEKTIESTNQEAEVILPKAILPEEQATKS